MTDKPRDAFVAGVVGGPGPVSPDLVKYDVAVNTPTGRMLYRGVRPANPRPMVDIAPAPINTPVGVSYVGDTIYFTIPEQVYYDPCPDTPPP